MEHLDCVVIGAGVVGLAIARQLARHGREVFILEAGEAFGQGISARSSEVIHAGLYYPEGSWKARLCVRGRALLYAFCAAHGVAHRRTGKVVVAERAAAIPALRALQQQGERNGVAGLSYLDAAALMRLSPALRGTAGLWSPETGIVDSHGLMQALLHEAEVAGATLILQTPALSVRPESSGIVVRTGGREPAVLRARSVINAAGLGAQALAQASSGLAPERIPPLAYAKGSYFSLPGRCPFPFLVYPLPEAHGLGIHLTLDLAGQARFGPDVSWVAAQDFTVDPAKAPVFEAAVRRYWPDLPEGVLQPAYAGIRPKTVMPGQESCTGPQDFTLLGPAEHGVPGLMHLFGIESPGLTASLALAEHVAAVI